MGKKMKKSKRVSPKRADSGDFAEVPWSELKRTEIRLSPEACREFVEAILNPPPLSESWQRAKAAHRRLIKTSR